MPSDSCNSTCNQELCHKIYKHPEAYGDVGGIGVSALQALPGIVLNLLGYP